MPRWLSNNEALHTRWPRRLRITTAGEQLTAALSAMNEGMVKPIVAGGSDYAPNERRNAVIQRARHGVSTYFVNVLTWIGRGSRAITWSPISPQLAGSVWLRWLIMTSVTTERLCDSAASASEVTTWLIARGASCARIQRLLRIPARCDPASSWFVNAGGQPDGDPRVRIQRFWEG